MKLMKPLSLIAAVTLLSACGSSHQIYYWGSNEYSDSVYSYLNQEGDPQKQIKDLENLIAKSPEKNKKVAPGVYAHLGLLYNQIGNGAKAQELFNKEAELFPESKQYMQFLLNKGKISGTETAKPAAKGAK